MEIIAEIPFTMKSIYVVICTKSREVIVKVQRFNHPHNFLYNVEWSVSSRRVNVNVMHVSNDTFNY